jgi:hypothetical protein
MIFRCTRHFHETTLTIALAMPARRVAAQTLKIGRLSLRGCWPRAHQRSRILLTASPLSLTGAVGSPATPMATA